MRSSCPGDASRTSARISDLSGKLAQVCRSPRSKGWETGCRKQHIVILPVQGPGGYELVINFKTARAFRPWHQQECPPNKIVIRRTPANNVRKCSCSSKMFAN